MGKNFNKNNSASGQQVRVGLEKDIDFHNQRLWKRKKYQQQIKKQDMRKTFREYKRVKDDLGDDRVDPKQKEFYENLFKQEPSTVVVDPKDKVVEKVSGEIEAE